MYPNPTTGIVNINARLKVRAVLRNVAGKSVLEVSANGVYMLYISDMEGKLLKAEKINNTIR